LILPRQALKAIFKHYIVCIYKLDRSPDALQARHVDAHSAKPTLSKFHSRGISIQMKDEDLQLLFRPDGTPKYLRFDRSNRRLKPPSIAIDIGWKRKTRFQHRVGVPAKDVEETWALVGEMWLAAVGLTKRSAAGRKAAARFAAALHPFLERYEIKTDRKWIFTEE
jgi:hypothetical protein